MVPEKHDGERLQTKHKRIRFVFLIKGSRGFLWALKSAKQTKPIQDKVLFKTLYKKNIKLYILSRFQLAKQRFPDVI